jgi:signal transduction histidine kinase
VLATRDDHRVDEDTRNAWLALGALALALVALATGAAVLFGRRLSLPLERLAGTAGRLGSGDFSVRAPRSGVAEIDALSAAMDTTAERLDVLVTRERAFSVDASHQLRTPLAALRIELEAMQLRRDTDPELAAALVQVDRLQTTIDTLLSVARDASSAAATTDVVGVVDDAIERWRGRLAEAGRPLRSRAEGRPARALANPGVLQEILDVLLDNALRHGAGEVDVTVRDLDGWVAVEVRDEGSGFADPDAAFARRSGRAAGHGIGLALARSLAHAEGGRLTVVHPGPAPVLSIAVRSDPGAGGPAR